jgi:hypothetical protein
MLVRFLKNLVSTYSAPAAKCTYLHEFDPKYLKAQLEKERLARLEAEKRAKDALMFSATRADMKESLKTFENVFAKKLKEANTLDLVIVMDCTGSMGAWIKTAKEELLRIVDGIKSDENGAAVRVGFVAYRDWEDGIDRISTQPLTSDIASIQRFIQSQTAKGGGDTPEDVNGGLQAALDMQWTSEAKCIILVGDAPCHGSEYHTCSDSAVSLANMHKSPCIRGQMRHMAAQGFDFTFIEVVPNSTKKMADILQQEYASAQPLDGFRRKFTRTQLGSSGDTTKFSSVVRSSAGSSLAASKSRSVAVGSKGMFSSIHHYGPTGRMSGLMPVLEEEDGGEGGSSRKKSTAASATRPLDWAAIEALAPISVRRNTLHMRPGVSIDWSSPDLKHTQQLTSVKLSDTPFSNGAMRSACGMIDLTTNKRMVAKKCFVRSFKSVEAELSAIRKDIEAQAVAKYLATLFSSQENLGVALDFIFTTWYEVLDPRTNKVVSVFSAEPYIPGEYKKYTNNSDWKEKGAFCDAAQAFSHFTWQYTFGKLMVVDLQGVNYILTDPQVHCLDTTKFGIGNLGKDGMCKFFHNHVCNRICRKLHLAPFKEDPTAVIEPQPSLLLWCVRWIICLVYAIFIVPTGSTQSVFKMATKMASEPTLGTPVDCDIDLSCCLCGEIFCIKHSKFLELTDRKKEVYCTGCTGLVHKREKRDCKKCTASFDYSPYYYVMKGMESPRTCKVCKEEAVALLGAKA